MLFTKERRVETCGLGCRGSFGFGGDSSTKIFAQISQEQFNNESKIYQHLHLFIYDNKEECI